DVNLYPRADRARWLDRQSRGRRDLPSGIPTRRKKASRRVVEAPGAFDPTQVHAGARARALSEARARDAEKNNRAERESMFAPIDSLGCERAAQSRCAAPDN